MINLDSLAPMRATETKSAVVEFFDPPMCCPTGLCGPVLDQLLLDINEMILSLEAEGITVIRYQMTSSPQAFLNNPEVIRLVREQPMAALPITVVKGKVIKVGDYPAISEIKIHLNGAI